MVDCELMTQDTNPPRAAVVIKTVDKQRIKPSCPMCGAVSWGTPVPANAPGEKLQAVVTAISGESLQTHPVNLWVCMNCGFVWQRLIGVTPPTTKDEEHE